jgi:hypothetical protein
MDQVSVLQNPLEFMLPRVANVSEKLPPLHGEAAASARTAVPVFTFHSFLMIVTEVPSSVPVRRLLSLYFTRN